MGIRAAVGATLAPDAAGSVNEPLSSLVAHASWNSDLSLAFNLATFNRPAFLGMLRTDAADLDRLDVARGHDRWWTWPAEPVDDAPRPSWWNVPVAFVVGAFLSVYRSALTDYN